MLDAIRGFSNKTLALKCFDKDCRLVDCRMFEAIRRLDYLEDVYDDYCQRHGCYRGRISEKYPATELLNDELYDQLLEYYEAPPPLTVPIV